MMIFDLRISKNDIHIMKTMYAKFKCDFDFHLIYKSKNVNHKS